MRLHCKQRHAGATSGQLARVRTGLSSAGGTWGSEIGGPRGLFSGRSSALRFIRATAASGALACASPALVDDSMAQEKCALSAAARALGSWLAGWMAGCLAGSLAGWLTNWLSHK